MNRTENQPGNVLDEYLKSFLEKIDQRWETIANSPSLMAFWMMGISVLIVLLAPVLAVGIQWVVDLFTVDPKNIIIENMLFEAMVVGLVFAFGIGLLFSLIAKARSLTYLIVFISFILTILATSMFGVTANKCLSDIQCDGIKFIASMGIAFVLSLVSYIFLRGVNKDTSPFAIPYLAVCIWESLLWLWQAARSIGIKPTLDAWQGVFLLLSSILWLVIFGVSAKKTDVKAVQPNRWGT